jgi:putative transport protein
MILLAVGSMLGAVSWKGVRLGPAAVLFAAIAVSSLGTAYDVKLQVPEIVGNLGLVLFTYTVGIVSGPNFFASLRRGWGPMLLVVAAVSVAAGAAVLVGRLLGLTGPVIAGSMAGALNNTPSLAAATERAGGAAGPTIGYSIAYLFGVFAMMFTTLLVLRNTAADESTPTSLTNLTVRVDHEHIGRIKDVIRRHEGSVAFSRLAHGAALPIEIADEDMELAAHDLVVVVGPADELRRVAIELGHESSHTLQSDRTDVDFRRITLSNPALAGRSIAGLGLEERFGAMATRIRRGDLDMVAHGDFLVQMGDRLRVTAPAGRIKKVSDYLGDSERGLSDINPIGFALGLALGVLLGLVHVPLPGGGFTVGAAAGTLVVGLIFGRLVRLGPLVVSMSISAASSLSNFGMLTFLAYAGSRAGEQFIRSVTSDVGWKVLIVGVVTTSLVALAVAVLGRKVTGTTGPQLAGMVAGAQTQPAVLAFANDRSGFDVRVGLGYALVYPAAMVIKILLAQVIAGL